MRSALAALLVLLPSSAFAYELTGGSWRLDAYPNGVPYCPVINARHATTPVLRADFGDAVDGGMLAWTEAGFPIDGIPGIPCSAYRAQKSSCSGTPNEGDSQPWIWWESNWGSISGVGPSTIGVTPYWLSANGVL